MAKSGTTLSLRFRGVHGSTPSPGGHTARYGGNTSCVELRADNEILILDAGTGIRDLGIDLMEQSGSKSIEATLLISHTHWDHIQGLPFFGPVFSGHNHIRLLAAPGAGATLRRGLRNQTDPIHFPVPVEQMRGLGAVEELGSGESAVGPFRVAVTSLNHPGGCAGFRIEANGASVAYLPDHEPFQSITAANHTGIAQARTEALADFVRGVDLLILDTQYTETEYPNRIGWGHGCLPDSVALAVTAGVRQLALFHLDPAHNDEQIDAMVDQARRLAKESHLKIRGAAENDVLVFSAPDFRVVKGAAA